MDDTFRFEDFGFFCELGNIDPITPSFQRRTATIPGKAGAWDFGVEIGEKPVSFPLKTVELIPTRMQQKFNQFVYFLLNEKGQPRDIKVVFDYDPNKYRMMKLAQQIIPERLMDEGIIELTLIASDPYAYMPNDTFDPIETYLYNTGLDYNTGLQYKNPKGFTWKSTRQITGVYNYLHYRTPLSLTIEGSVISPHITNRTTGQTLALPTLKNEKLEIDGKGYSLIRNRQYSLQGLFGDFIDLNGGPNDLLFHGGDPNAVVTYTWEYRTL